MCLLNLFCSFSFTNFYLRLIILSINFPKLFFQAKNLNLLRRDICISIDLMCNCLIKWNISSVCPCLRHFLLLIYRLCLFMYKSYYRADYYKNIRLAKLASLPHAKLKASPSKYFMVYLPCVRLCWRDLFQFPVHHCLSCKSVSSVVKRDSTMIHWETLEEICGWTGENNAFNQESSAD